MARHKQNNCLNCGNKLSPSNNYCDQCGQENTERRHSFVVILKEFLGDFFAYDSRIFRSVFHLLCSPGLLTKSFNKGQRVRFLPPFRFFLLSGVVFFSLLTYQLGNESFNVEVNDQNFKLSELSPQKITKLFRDQIQEDFLENIDSLPPEQQDSMRLLAVLEADKEIAKINEQADSILKKNDEITFLNSGTEEIVLGSDTIGMEPIIFRGLQLSEVLPVEDVLDTLKITSFRDRLIFGQTLKAIKQSGGNLVSYFFSRLSLMVLLMIPVIALILKLIYIRHKEFYYIDHLIFALHLHTFFYLSGIIPLVFYGQIKILFIIVTTIQAIYTYLAIKKVYEQSILKTTIKYALLSILYTYCIVFFLAGTLILSFFTF